MITKVTVNGADDKTNPKDLLELSKLYPFVEFGILLSKDSQGRTRYPSSDWIESLLDVDMLEGNSSMQFSGHFCGEWAKQLLLANVTEVADVIDNYGFDRWQINTHGVKHKWSDWFIKPILSEFEYREQDVIFKIDDVNTELVNAAIQEGVMSHYKGLSGLFDLSHGAGILPKDWPKPIVGLKMGYAGGLSPINVGEQIEKIVSLVGKDYPFWIDAETHLRSDTDDTFDLNKIDAFLKVSADYVEK